MVQTATMRVTLVPLHVGDETFGPYDCVRFVCNRSGFDGVLAAGLIYVPLVGRGPYCLQCEPLERAV
jgi:hypothetical protein